MAPTLLVSILFAFFARLAIPVSALSVFTFFTVSIADRTLEKRIFAVTEIMIFLLENLMRSKNTLMVKLFVNLMDEILHLQ